MNIAESFAEYMEDNSFGTLGTDLFIATLPIDAPIPCWWVVLSGGAPAGTNETGEMMKDYILTINYRDTDQQQVYESLHSFEEFINGDSCDIIGDFDTIDINVVLFPTDQDIDSREITQGLAQVQIKTYYKE